MVVVELEPRKAAECLKRDLVFRLPNQGQYTPECILLNSFTF